MIKSIHRSSALLKTLAFNLFILQSAIGGQVISMPTLIDNKIETQVNQGTAILLSLYILTII